MNTRYCTRFYSAYDVKGITEFLDKMATKGWILKSKSGVGYKFEKTDMPYFRYDITFFADASKENDYLICAAGTSFDSKGDDVMSHGGITVDEVIVPFITIKAVENNG